MRELRYLGELVGWVDHLGETHGAFTPANEDAVWLNFQAIERYAA